MRITYDRLDAILFGLEQGLDEKTVAERAETSVKEVERIAAIVRMSSHKRKIPPAPKIGLRTPGLDWREADEDI